MHSIQQQKSAFSERACLFLKFPFLGALTFWQILVGQRLHNIIVFARISNRHMNNNNLLVAGKTSIVPRKRK